MTLDQNLENSLKNNKISFAHIGIDNDTESQFKLKIIIGLVSKIQNSDYLPKTFVYDLRRCENIINKYKLNMPQSYANINQILVYLQESSDVIHTKLDLNHQLEYFKTKVNARI